MDRLIKRVIRFYRNITSRRYGWHGNYHSWQEAHERCTGYNAANILEKVKNATRKVKNGEAIYERDAVLFDTIEYSWPLLANLLWIANKEQGQLSLLDFGGSLGSSYFQNRGYLQSLKTFRWSIVEQEDFVSIGRKEIAEGPLQFFYTINEAIAERGQHNVLLLSCVLPYLENPHAFLNEVIQKKIPYIIIDNTYFNPRKGDRLTVQKVPAYYYEASYPAWFLDYATIKAVFGDSYETIAEFTNDQFLYFYGEKINYRGFVMQLKR